MKDFDIEDRVNQAVQNFKSGFNCSQSVFLAYSDVFELDLDIARKVSVSFGGGLGRMREVCGTVSAMAMLAGFKYPVLDTNDQEARAKNYEVVQKMANLFKEKHETIICKKLLGPSYADTTPVPEVRDAEYYAKRPCGHFVADAAYIAGRMLKGEYD